jgi:hypothetical protein
MSMKEILKIVSQVTGVQIERLYPHRGGIIQIAADSVGSSCATLTTNSVSIKRNFVRVGGLVKLDR